MPDERAAQRLLDMLTQLEHALANMPKGKAATGQQEEVVALQAENSALRNRQQQAIQRLKQLLQHLPEKDTKPETTEAAA